MSNSKNSNLVFTTPTRELRCAIVGCGGVSQQYLSVYRDVPGVEVRYCVDTDPVRAREAASMVSDHQRVPARAEADYREALGDDVDVVIISTPNHLHAEHALAALAAGKHILLQKPVAPTYEDSLGILHAARAQREKGVLAGLYMSYLEQPAIQEMIAMARRGFFGRITQLHARLMHSYGVEWSRQNLTAHEGDGVPWRSSIRQTGGGAFIQLAVHHIRLFRCISGEPAVSVRGYAGNLECPGLEGEDTAAAIFQLESGACATLNLSWCSAGEELSIRGTEGSAIYLGNAYLILNSRNDWQGDAVTYKGGTQETFSFPPVDGSDAASPFNRHKLFLKAVLEGTEPPVSLADGVEDMAVVSAFYESIRTGRTATVPSHHFAVTEEK